MKKIQKVLKEQKGFTLVELVVVIAILGILIAIAVPKFADITGTAQERAQQATARTIMSAIVMAQAKNPTTEPKDIDEDMVNEFLEDVKIVKGDPKEKGEWGFSYTDNKWVFKYYDGTKTKTVNIKGE